MKLKKNLNISEHICKNVCHRLDGKIIQIKKNKLEQDYLHLIMRYAYLHCIYDLSFAIN